MRRLLLLLSLLACSGLAQASNIGKVLAIGGSAATILGSNVIKATTAGFEYGEDRSIYMTRVRVQWQWEEPILQHNRWELIGRWEFVGGQFRVNSDDDMNEVIASAGITPLFQFQPLTYWKGIKPYLETGIGFQYLSQTRLNDEDFSTNFQFGDHIGLGIKTRSFEVGYRFVHISNGDIERPNPGLDFHIISFLYHY